MDENGDGKISFGE
jgi:hypothetical protein